MAAIHCLCGADIKYSELRDNMVSNQIFARGVRAENVLEAMRDVPREAFVREDLPAVHRHLHERGIGARRWRACAGDRRVRAAGVSFQDHQDLLGHRSGRMTTHYFLGIAFDQAISVSPTVNRTTTLSRRRSRPLIQRRLERHTRSNYLVCATGPNDPFSFSGA